jgi:hypothetical protein
VRIDKAAARRKGKWGGGLPVLGYDVDASSKKLVINEKEAAQVRAIFALYLRHRGLLPALAERHRVEDGAQRPDEHIVLQAVETQLAAHSSQIPAPATAQDRGR